MSAKKTVFFFLLTIQFLFGQTFIIPNLQREDFGGTTLHSWWKSGIYPSGSSHSLTVNNGYLIAHLVDPLNGGTGGRLQSDYNGMENVGFSSVTDQIYDKHIIVDMTIRIKTLNSLPTGSRGWGMWRSEGVPITLNQNVWFMQQTADSDSAWAADETWWRARSDRGVESDNDIHTDLSTIDNTQWHTYRIVRNSESVSTGYYDHYIDGTLVQHVTPNDFNPAGIINEDYEFHCWNDNLVYYHTQNVYSGNDTIEVFYNGWTGTSSFVVDFIEIYKDGFSPKYEVTPQDASDFLRLRKYESEIDDGISDGLWKSYSFDTNDGNTFVIITAKAENLGSYDDDDDLKVVIDGNDYGYDNSNSWNGDVDDGQPKTLVFTPSLSAGSHTIKLYSQVTPILYDVNVLNSSNGSLVLDQTLNETAPSNSSNYLWKQFDFSCDAGPIAIYVSASADDEPGWDYKNANIDSSDDDELRIALDNTDYGWGGDYGFVGDSLHGDAETVLIRDTVEAGSHTLKLYANETPTVYRVIVFAQNGDYSLPVTFSAFTAQALDNNRVKLQWRTESELENYGFNIFRAFSQDSTLPENTSFKKLNQSVIPGHGNSSRAHEYLWVDTLQTDAPFVWYRLYSLDFNGSVHLLKTVTVKMPIMAGSFRLFPNYPNPFNPTTRLHFRLKEKARVEIIIYNLQGRRVRNLWQGVLNSGDHYVIWDGCDGSGNPQSSGIYFYQIKTLGKQWIGKMTLLR